MICIGVPETFRYLPIQIAASSLSNRDPIELVYPIKMTNTNVMRPPLVSVDAVSHRYAGAAVPALDDIHLTIPEGCCFGLLGPNGAGKTTLISLLTGVLVPQQGRIEIAGFRFPGDASRIKDISALVPQDYAFYPALTGRENLRFFAGLYRIARAEQPARLDYSIDVCGLGKVLDQRAGNYSGGIKRRLNMALGLLNRPKILYLDEPTVGIDAQTRHFILQAIEGLKAGGMTIVYTSHYMEEVEQICDEIVIVDQGKIILCEPLNELLQGARQVVVLPVEPPSAADLAALAAVVTVAWDGVHLTLQPLAQQSLSQVLAQMERVGISPRQLHTGMSRLEDVYLRATRYELRR